MNPLLLLRMARLARQRPSLRLLAVVAAVLALCAVLVGIERIWGWPAWLMPGPRGTRLPLR